MGIDVSIYSYKTQNEVVFIRIGADSTGARGIFAPLLLKVGGQKYHFAPLLSGNFNINVYQKSNVINSVKPCRA